MSNKIEERVRIRLTIPKGIYDRAVKFAEDQGRTVNNLIVHTVNTYLKRNNK